MSNPFAGRFLGASGPAFDLVPVVSSDAVEFESVAVALYIETGGDLSFVSALGRARTVKVGDLSILPVGVKQVMATGTTASGIHAFVV
ncbi:spike base protein, RCAP_Rcc01079 family [Celeribacter ethanolicus]|uniref:spike base protein, RCAP_Rcc01079 family n=1 Tax=Celeribacter ethanolicus TaxID=1758178 RepID=UPI000834234F|nr:hypothetical protein [Celeribacter ethanolicus]